MKKSILQIFEHETSTEKPSNYYIFLSPQNIRGLQVCYLTVYDDLIYTRGIQHYHPT